MNPILEPMELLEAECNALGEYGPPELALTRRKIAEDTAGTPAAVDRTASVRVPPEDQRRGDAGMPPADDS